MQTQVINESTLPNQRNNIHHLFAAYMMPPIIVIGFLENCFTLAILLGLRVGNGMGHTTRFLFVALTISDMLNLVVHYGLNLFGGYGLRTLTNGSLSLNFSIGPAGNIACRAVRTASFFTLHCQNWMYVLINVQRLIAISCPHSARRFLNTRNAGLILFLMSAFGAACGVLFGASFYVRPHFGEGGSQQSDTLCVTDTSRRALAVVARLLFDIDVLSGTNLLSLLLALLLFSCAFMRSKTTPSPPRRTQQATTYCSLNWISRKMARGISGKFIFTLCVN